MSRTIKGHRGPLAGLLIAVRVCRRGRTEVMRKEGLLVKSRIGVSSCCGIVRLNASRAQLSSKCRGEERGG